MRILKKTNPLYLIFILLCQLVAAGTAFGQSEALFWITDLDSANTTANTGEKPQSKVWFFEGSWWAVFPNSSAVPGDPLYF